MNKNKTVEFYDLLQELGSLKEEFWAFCEKIENFDSSETPLVIAINVNSEEKKLAYLLYNTYPPLTHLVKKFLLKILASKKDCIVSLDTPPHPLISPEIQIIKINLLDFLPPALVRYEKEKLYKRLAVFQAQCPHTATRRYNRVGQGRLMRCLDCDLEMRIEDFYKSLKSKKS